MERGPYSAVIPMSDKKQKGKQKKEKDHKEQQPKGKDAPKKQTKLGLETRKEDNYSDWYSQVENWKIFFIK